jgi:hypothetical protein
VWCLAGRIRFGERRSTRHKFLERHSGRRCC